LLLAMALCDLVQRRLLVQNDLKLSFVYVSARRLPVALPGERDRRGRRIVGVPPSIRNRA
ncbi:hypothetical protein ACC686_36200, partial [Rhizobium johnstonii]|uniref:hypothetical protein n=1 Tax=Rhizobium johnstonii TaxID=3019933 RepID=UPI003F95D031